MKSAIHENSLDIQAQKRLNDLLYGELYLERYDYNANLLTNVNLQRQILKNALHSQKLFAMMAGAIKQLGSTSWVLTVVAGSDVLVITPMSSGTFVTSKSGTVSTAEYVPHAITHHQVAVQEAFSSLPLGAEDSRPDRTRITGSLPGCRYMTVTLLTPYAEYINHTTSVITPVFTPTVAPYVLTGRSWERFRITVTPTGSWALTGKSKHPYRVESKLGGASLGWDCHYTWTGSVHVLIEIADRLNFITVREYTKVNTYPEAMITGSIAYTYSVQELEPTTGYEDTGLLATVNYDLVDLQTSITDLESQYQTPMIGKTSATYSFDDYVTMFESVGFIVAGMIYPPALVPLMIAGQAVHLGSSVLQGDTHGAVMAAFQTASFLSFGGSGASHISEVPERRFAIATEAKVQTERVKEFVNALSVSPELVESSVTKIFRGAREISTDAPLGGLVNKIGKIYSPEGPNVFDRGKLRKNPPWHSFVVTQEPGVSTRLYQTIPGGDGVKGVWSHAPLELGEAWLDFYHSEFNPVKEGITRLHYDQSMSELMLGDSMRAYEDANPGRTLNMTRAARPDMLDFLLNKTDLQYIGNTFHSASSIQALSRTLFTEDGPYNLFQVGGINCHSQADRFVDTLMADGLDSLPKRHQIAYADHLASIQEVG
jgi:hypothetical protein